ncbi:MAG: hypothetical protein A4S14_00600 [Proteobacteria bacterium SG_bin9]|nr:MAG: hypothetical protein A4S14_00600 [Proteobacteria bacterium SG_bin9]
MRLLGRVKAIAVLATMFVVATASAAFAEKRVALVVGISKYQHVPQLTNPARDAAAMGDLFRNAGFDVVELKRDLSIADMRRTLRDFSVAAATADMAAVYYAGHGIEVNGVNYLIPADARLVSDYDVEDETVPLDRVLKAIEPAKKLRMVILDACRENPFQKTMQRSVGTRAISRGLAEVDPQLNNTVVAYAAKGGALASDGDGANSPFALALVKHIASPGLDLRLAFGRVRDEVKRLTNNRQEPFVYASLGGDTVALVPQAAAPVAPPPDPQAAARRDYELAAQVGTKEAWASFLGTHKSGLYADLARSQQGKLIEAETARLKADAARTQAEKQAQDKADDFRRQLEEQAKKQADDARRQYSEQSKKELEVARQQIAEQAKRELDEARRQAAEANKQADDARKQVEAAKAQGVEEARKRVEEAKKQAEEAAKEAARKAAEEKAAANPKVAALSPSDQPAPAPVVPAMDPGDVARLLQAHLKRVGCDPGNSDGKWDDKSQKALDLFNKNASTKFEIKLASLDALDGVRAKTSRVCPLICAKGQKADGDRCVQITCDSGFMLNSSGTCVKRPDPPAPKPRVAQERERPEPRRAAPAAAPSGGGGGGKCFTFNGKRYCE